MIHHLYIIFYARRGNNPCSRFKPHNPIFQACIWAIPGIWPGMGTIAGACAGALGRWAWSSASTPGGTREGFAMPGQAFLAAKYGATSHATMSNHDIEAYWSIMGYGCYGFSSRHLRRRCWPVPELWNSWIRCPSSHVKDSSHIT